MAGAYDVNAIEVAGLDDPVEMRIDEVQSWGRPPMAEQTRFDVVDSQRSPKERIVEEIDLPDREIVAGSPVGIDAVQLIRT